MKRSLTICSLLIGLISIGQSPVRSKQKFNPYKKESELQLVTEVDSLFIVATYKIDAGFEGHNLKINWDGTFLETSYNCDGIEPVADGTWKVNEGKLFLQNDGENEEYEFVAFRNLLFLVSPKQRGKFIKEFRRAFKETSEDKEENVKIHFAARVLRSMYILYYHKWQQ